MSEAIKYMHSVGVCHRDIKAENVIISDKNTVKIIDFGFSVRFTPDTGLRVFCGTSYYMPPEIVLKRQYNGFKSDIWSLGVLLYLMLTSTFPFKGCNDKELFSRICTA